MAIFKRFGHSTASAVGLCFTSDANADASLLTDIAVAMAAQECWGHRRGPMQWCASTLLLWATQGAIAYLSRCPTAPACPSLTCQPCVLLSCPAVLACPQAAPCPAHPGLYPAPAPAAPAPSSEGCPECAVCVEASGINVVGSLLAGIVLGWISLLVTILWLWLVRLCARKDAVGIREIQGTRAVAPEVGRRARGVIGF